MLRIFTLIVSFIFISPAISADKVIPSTRQQVQLSYAPLVKHTANAVVNIYTSKTVTTRARNPLFNDPFFRQFFGPNFPAAPSQKQKKVQNSLGSGVIVRPDGIVVTNYHVIEGADDIKVVLNDRREFSAVILGTDKRTDLAILKVDPGKVKLPVLALGDSDNVEVGDLVLAIGNPFGVGQTVTSGIVSALARTRVGITDYSFFIQTDAAINPGNSGGALVDMQGRLIGVNSAIYSKGGGSNGIGFAIPVNMVRSVLSGVNDEGRVVRPWFGASGEVVTQDLADALGMKRPYGVLISKIYTGGPADKAGLARGDVLIGINGHEVSDPQAFRFRLATLSLGEEAVFSVLRKGERLSMTFEALPPPETPKRDARLVRGKSPFTGATVVNMSPAMNDEAGWDTMAEGVAILNVNRGSIAARLGFHRGDQILGINGLSVGSTEDLQRILVDLERKQGNWAIDIMRNGKKVELAFRG